MQDSEPTAFLETLKIVDGCFVRPEAHRQRMIATLSETGNLPREIPVFADRDIPQNFRSGTVKCRCRYTAQSHDLSFQSYTPLRPRSLQMVDGTGIDYHLKYADRSALNRMLSHRGESDEILIVQHGEITDTSYSNIVLFDGENYVTPRACLLNGTKRQHLLTTRRIREAVVTPDNIRNYTRIYLINAMIDLEDNISVRTADVFL